MNKALADLIKISRTVGKDSMLVQGGGGNTSVKTPNGKYMFIKASGTALKDMDQQCGWRKVKLDIVNTIVTDKKLATLTEQKQEAQVVTMLLNSCDDDTTAGARPSIETPLHAMLDDYVIHLHPLMVSAYVNAKNGKTLFEKIFKNEKFPALWVPYINPGYSLARKLAKMVNAYEKEHGRKPAILFLEKHGVFVTANSKAAAMKLVSKVIDACETKLKTIKTGRAKNVSQEQINETRLVIRNAYHEATGAYMPVWQIENDMVTAFLNRKDGRQLLNAGALAPDELAYVDGPALWVDKINAKIITAKLKKQIEQGKKPAGTFFVNNVELFAACDPKRLATVNEIATGSLMIRIWASGFGGLNCLNRKQENFINQWEAESFRRKLASRANEGTVKDRIAIVTGAGSGIGRSIAIGLARSGAMIALADIDTTAAKETAELITAEIPNACTKVVACNVTSEDSVDDAFANLIDTWGGLDIVVNAAGVAPAYSLVDLPVAQWRFALEVNLTGYFLMARGAARIMIAQGMGGNIVNISSKSGLDASKNNTPYNATKAGELHMARGWAMELGEHGIRVNNVCPGNVFEGSKIWNPEYIRTCAKKYGIRPEEVIPFYVSKTHLKREIKGQDIADAVAYLCSDQARVITGQTIVADSGQVFVR